MLSYNEATRDLCSNIMELRTKYKDLFFKKHGIKLGFMSAFVRACSYSLERQPIVNAVIDDKHIVYRDYVDISVAVATPRVRTSVGYRMPFMSGLLLHDFDVGYFKFTNFVRYKADMFIRVFPRNNKVWAHGPMSLKFDGPFL